MNILEKLSAWNNKREALDQLANIKNTALGYEAYIVRDVRMAATVKEAQLFTITRRKNGRLTVSEVDTLAALVSDVSEKLKEGADIAEVVSQREEIMQQFQVICKNMLEANKLRHENKKRFMAEYESAYCKAMGIPENIESPFWNEVYGKVDKARSKINEKRGVLRVKFAGVANRVGDFLFGALPEAASQKTPSCEVAVQPVEAIEMPRVPVAIPAAKQ